MRKSKILIDSCIVIILLFTVGILLSKASILLNSSIVVNGVTMQIGAKPSVKSLDIIKSFYNSNAEYENDTKELLGTVRSRENYVDENYDSVEMSTSEDVMDGYLDGYHKNTNLRVLGGTVNNNYMSITVCNVNSKFTPVIDSKIKSIWILGNGVNFSYGDIKSGEKYEDIKDKLKDYEKSDDPRYGDMEYVKVNKGTIVYIYIKDDVVYGIKLSIRTKEVDVYGSYVG